MRQNFFPALGLAALLCADAAARNAAPIEFQSGTNATPLLELYTSEGCSSCPPAEAWRARMKDSPGIWKEIVPVAFHVDYWDHLGWKDPFATQASTQRQHSHASHWGAGSVYTPGFVFEGKEWRGWFNREAMPRAARRPVGVLTARSETGQPWTVRFDPAHGGTASACDLHAALLGFNLEVEVKAGENRGRVLPHDFVVIAFASATSTKTNGSYEAVLALNSNPKVSPKRLAVAAWVTPVRSLTPLQAVGGWLPRTNQAPIVQRP